MNIQNIIISSKNKEGFIVSGAGIIIIPAILIFVFFFYQEVDTSLISFLSISLILAIISFFDDLYSLPIFTRFVSHSIAVLFVFYALGFHNQFSLIPILIAYILSVGYVNIYNFMDGINGLSFLNTLSSFFAFYLINSCLISFTSTNFIIIILLTIVVFGYFNFRKQAKCFLGDVGSVSLGFIVLFLTINLFLASKNPLVFLILSVYSLDGGLTIIERLLNKENIFKTHQKHLYELLAYRLKVGHLKVSIVYFVIQSLINLFVYFALKIDYKKTDSFILFLALLSLLYVFVKRSVYKRIKALT